MAFLGVEVLAVEVSRTDSLDLLHCHHENPGSRQFCVINQANKVAPTPGHPVALTPEVFTVRTRISVRDQGISLEETRQLLLNPQLSLEVNVAGSVTTYPLIGLHPLLRMRINWDPSAECKRSSAWSHAVYLHSVDRSSDARLAAKTKVEVGNTDYEIDLHSTNSASHLAWDLVAVNDHEADLIAKFTIVDESYSSTAPWSVQRIPDYCKMNLTSAAIEFDVRGMRSDLSALSGYEVLSSEALRRCHVRNSGYLLGEDRAFCSIYDIWSVLSDYEAPELDQWSFSSQNAISKAVSSALDQKAISAFDIPRVQIDGEDCLDFWSYFRKDADAIKNRCDPTNNHPVPLQVSPDLFVLGGDGWANAKDYLREKNNVTRIVTAARAIIVAARSQIIDLLNQNGWIVATNPYESL